MAERIKGYGVPKPNLEFPLANSYIPRGTGGYTNTVTNSLDQRKVNMYYEVSKNSLSGNQRLSLSVRPGVEDYEISLGQSGQSTYLTMPIPGAISSYQLTDSVFTVFNGSSFASDQVTDVVLVTNALFIPTYVDRVAVNNIDNVVVQLVRNSALQVLQRVYYSSSFATFTQIVSTFTTFAHVGKMEHMDGYSFIFDKNNNRIQNSNLNTISTWPAENFITKQITQDRAQGLAKFQNKILSFGDNSVEVFYNAGLTPAPLLSIKNMSARIGLPHGLLADGLTTYASGHYYCEALGKMFFVGAIGNVTASKVGPALMTFDGSKFGKVSPPYIDKILQDAVLRGVNSIVFNGQVAVAITLTAFEISTQRWLMYFPSWDDWFEWTSDVFQPTNFNGTFIGIRANSRRIFTFPTSTEQYRDFTSSYSYLTQFRLPTDGPTLKKMPYYGVVADTASSTNNMTVEFNDADGLSSAWVTTATIDLSQENKMASRGGAFRERLVRLSGTTSTSVRLHKFVARIEE